MRFLIIFGTGEGHTGKIAEFISDRLMASGNVTKLVECGQKVIASDINSYDAVILAGSVHMKLHQEALINYILAHRGQLQKQPSLLISASLSIAFEGGQSEAESYVKHLVDYTGFTPTDTIFVAGALRYEKYDYFMKQVLEFIVFDDQDVIKEDKEFTDWGMLGEQIDVFADRLIMRT